MLAVLQYVTSGFGVWLESAILLAIATNGLWHGLAQLRTLILAATRR